MTSLKSKSSLLALCRVALVGTFGVAAIACGGSHGGNTGGGGESQTCQSAMQCLNGQACVGGKCVAQTMPSPTGTTLPPGPAPTGTTPPPGPAPSGSTQPPDPAPTGTTPTPDPAPQCRADLATCTVNSECCGYPSGHNYCVNTNSSLGTVCAIACTSGSACNSGCCAPLTTGGSVCAPASQCQKSCAGDLASCSVNGDCCGFSTGHNYCVNTGGSLGAICAISCTYNSECSSGCCAPLKSGGSVCAPASYCG